MNAQLAKTPTVSTSTQQLVVLPLSSSTGGTLHTRMQMGSKSNNNGVVNHHMDARSISDRSNSAGHNSANELDYNGANEEDEEEVLQVLQDDEASPKNMVLLDYSSKVNKDFNNLFSMQERAVLDLINILEPTGAPKYFNDAILKWAERHVTINLPTHSTLVNRMKEKYGQKDIDPIRIQKTLPSGNLCTLTKFDIKAQLFSLLSDTELMKPANLLSGGDPFYDIDESDFRYRHK